MNSSPIAFASKQSAPGVEQKVNPRLAGPSSKKVKFTKIEDEKLIELIKEFGENNWKLIAEKLPPRTPRQCRERWTNYVNPALSKDPWTKEEDELLIQKHNELGNHWKLIEKYFPARSKNNIKHRYSQIKEMPVVLTNPPSNIPILDDICPLNFTERDPVQFDSILEPQEMDFSVQGDLWTLPIDNIF